MPTRFTIKNTTVSGRAWGDVDKTRLRNILVQGLEEGAQGVREAIREVYAVIKSENLEDAPSQNWWGLHHEVQDDGTVVLNKGGVQAAAAALAGARAEPDLDRSQLRSAARHILRHYREHLEEEPPESLLELAGAGEMSLLAGISGEMSVDEIPLANGVDLEKLKAGDDDPLEVVVEIESGKSKRGWNYTKQTLQKIVEQVIRNSPNGFLGHQKPEEVSTEFPDIATHWIGAKFQDFGDKAKAFIRGYVDPKFKDLKRWIRAGRIKQVSIFGMPKLKVSANGETDVVDYQLLSIDWTPKDRNGMPTRVVAISGEMVDWVGEIQTNSGGEPKVNKEEVLKALRGMIASGEIKKEDLGPIVGEMFKSPAVGEMTEVRQLLGLDEGGDVKGEISTLIDKAKKFDEAQHKELVNKVLEKKVASKAARAIVGEMLKVDIGATEEQIAGEIDKLLAKDSVREAISMLYIDNPPPNPKGGVGQGAKYTRVRRVSI